MIGINAKYPKGQLGFRENAALLRQGSAQQTGTITICIMARDPGIVESVRSKTDFRAAVTRTGVPTSGAEKLELQLERELD